MKTFKNQKLLLIIGLSIVHHFIFWNQYWGVNTLIFSSLSIITIWFTNKKSFDSIYSKICTIGTIIAAILVIINGSDAAKFCYLMSFSIMIGFWNAPELRNIIFSFLSTLESILYIPKINMHGIL